MPHGSSRDDAVGREVIAKQMLAQAEARARRVPVPPRNERTTKDLRKQIKQARPIQPHRSGQAVPAQREPCRRHQGSVLLARSPPARLQNRGHARMGGRAQIPAQAGGNPPIHNPANLRSQPVNLRPERMDANAGMGIHATAFFAPWRHGVSNSPLHPARNPCMRRPGFLHPKTPRGPVFSPLRRRNVRREPVRDPALPLGLAPPMPS